MDLQKEIVKINDKLDSILQAVNGDTAARVAELETALESQIEIANNEREEKEAAQAELVKLQGASKGNKA